MRVGNKINSTINYEWAKHASSKYVKRLTSKKRRRIQMEIVKKEEIEASRPKDLSYKF